MADARFGRARSRTDPGAGPQAAPRGAGDALARKSAVSAGVTVNATAIEAASASEERDGDLREEGAGDALEEEERQGGERDDERCVDEGRPHGDRGLERDTRRRPLIPIRALA